jgi:hypothetical protein
MPTTSELSTHLSAGWKRWGTLLWFIPAVYGSIVAVILFTPIVDHQFLAKSKLLLAFVTPACLVAPFGGWWGVYQCVRYERHPFKYIVIVLLVPLGFFWYYFERYRYSERAIRAARDPGHWVD